MYLQSLNRSSTSNTSQRGEQVQTHIHKSVLGADSRAWAGQSCYSQGTGTRWWNTPWTCPKSPFATLSYQISIFIHANGAEENTNIKAKELNMKQGTFLLCSSFIPWELSHGNLMKSCFSTQALLWIKKPAVTASECYLGMELKSWQIAL